MKKKNFVSIILPVYNGEEFVTNAIKSILEQTYSNFELIIVNDCSTDNTLAIVERFAEKDNRVVIINNVENKKLPASLNIGHEKATGSYLTWTSDDNILKPNFLESLIQNIINVKADIVYSNYDVINDDGVLKRVHHTGPTEHILFGNKIGASFLYKKEVYIDLNGFDESLFLLEDFDFWLRASMHFKFYHIEDNLYQYRLHSESLTSEIYNDKKVIIAYKDSVLKMFKKVASKFSWNMVTFDLLTNKLLGEHIIVLNYLKNKVHIEEDLLRFNIKEFDADKVIFGMQLSLRNEMITNKCNHNIKTLLGVLRNEKSLLFHSSFSKKTTYTYILKCLFK